MESTTTAAILGCCISGVVILLLRLVLRKVYFHHLDLGDYLAAAAILTLAAYISTIYVAIVWGTANVDSSNALTPQEIRRRTVGSKCVLVARVMYISTNWILKSVLLVFYSQIIVAVWYGHTMMHITIIILAITYCVSVITVLVGCRPLSLNWTIILPPAPCVRALTFLFVEGALDIFTQIILILLPLPVLFKVYLPWLKKLCLCLLFTLGFCVVAASCVRLAEVSQDPTSQNRRTLWAVVELLCACIVANAPALYATIMKFVQRGGRLGTY